MGSEEITVRDQWDTVATIKELTALELMVIRFMEHTLHTMSQPRMIQTPFGETALDDEVVHPLGELLGRIRAMRDACYRQYGKEQWEQGVLFNQGEIPEPKED